MNKRKNILITGANRGIGYGIVKNLIGNFINKNKINEGIDNFLTFPYFFIFTSRDKVKGIEAISNLKKEFSIFPFDDLIIFEELDISNPSNIENLISSMKQKNLKLDTLVNNASIYIKSNTNSLDTYQQTFDINLFGTIDLTEKLLKENLINRDGKIINITSDYGIIHLLEKESLKKEFRKATSDKEFCFYLANRFKEAIKNNLIKKEGWVPDCYHISKMIVNKYTEILANDSKIKEEGIQVYSCHPGWVQTDMGGPYADLTIDEGCETPIYLIELEHVFNQKFQGKFFADKILTDSGL